MVATRLGLGLLLLPLAVCGGCEPVNRPPGAPPQQSSPPGALGSSPAPDAPDVAGRPAPRDGGVAPAPSITPQPGDVQL